MTHHLFFCVDCGIADKSSFLNALKYAAPPVLAGQAEPHTHCISKKAAGPGGRQVTPSPSEGERSPGDVGAPTGAVD